jgi:hypothetical protein
MQFSIGADPELFLKRGDKYVSAIGIIGGTKETPRPIKELGRGFAVQEDNVLCEYNIPACGSPRRWCEAHKAILDYLTNSLQEKGLTLAPDAAAIMPEEELRHPMAHVFGCEPDYNVWTLKPNPRPKAANPNLRSAGGHVHVGIRATNPEKVLLGRMLDCTLGLWSVIHDPDTMRKELYGKSGAVRLKPYGIEYRVMSNFWLKSEDAVSEVYEWVRFSLSKYLKHNIPPEVATATQEAINTNNKPLAQKLLKAL